MARPNNELKVKEWISIGKIETAIKPYEEDSDPVFAFNNVTFEHSFTGSQLDYISTVDQPFIQKTKIYIIFKLGVKIIFQVSIHNCLFGAVKLARNANARNVIMMVL